MGMFMDKICKMSAEFGVKLYIKCTENLLK